MITTPAVRHIIVHTLNMGAWPEDATDRPLAWQTADGFAVRIGEVNHYFVQGTSTRATPEGLEF